ncbi:uncharacterized protein C6orf47 homolog [Anolis sagrei]|uniref:uncharacterized protein C6orf47 homolog n=1 Tax=Anolis sagrei TaxID=38937 RepID=UPI003522127A
MFFSRAKSWLPGLPWRRPKAEDVWGKPQEDWKEGFEKTPPRAPPPSKARWWNGRRILEAIGWGENATGGAHSLLASIPQHLTPPKASMESPEHFQICFNFARHLFDLCVVTLLCASSPAFRLVLDIVGLGGPIKVWLHGFACFLVTAYGMYLALWLVQEYLVQFACLYGFLQTLVLCVSIRAGPPEPQEDEQSAELDVTKGEAGKEEEPSATDTCKQ